MVPPAAELARHPVHEPRRGAGHRVEVREPGRGHRDLLDGPARVDDPDRRAAHDRAVRPARAALLMDEPCGRRGFDARLDQGEDPGRGRAVVLGVRPKPGEEPDGEVGPREPAAGDQRLGDRDRLERVVRHRAGRPRAPAVRLHPPAPALSGRPPPSNGAPSASPTASPRRQPRARSISNINATHNYFSI